MLKIGISDQREKSNQITGAIYKEEHYLITTSPSEEKAVSVFLF